MSSVWKDLCGCMSDLSSDLFVCLFVAFASQWTANGSLGPCGQVAPKRVVGGGSRETGSASAPSLEDSRVPENEKRSAPVTKRGVQVCGCSHSRRCCVRQKTLMLFAALPLLVGRTP